MGFERTAFTRRRFAAGGATLAIAAIAGCTGELFGGDDPETVVEEFLGHFDDPDAETLNEYIHPDSPTDEVEEGEVESPDGVEMIIDSVEEVDPDELAVDDVIEDDEEQAFVVVSLTWEIEDEDEEHEDVSTYELRQDDGEWLLWEPYPGDLTDEDQAGVPA